MKKYIFALLILAGFIYLNNQYHFISITFKKDEFSDYEQNAAISNFKNEIAFIVITSSTCPSSRQKSLPTIIHKLKLLIQQKAEKLDYNFVTVGISLDKNPQKGIQYLKKFGDFNELLSGNGWSNTGLERYVYNNIAGTAEIPQVLITRRNYDTIDHQGNKVRVGILKEVQLIRKIGFKNIRGWYENEGVLPEDLFVIKK